MLDDGSRIKHIVVFLVVFVAILCVCMLIFNSLSTFVRNEINAIKSQPTMKEIFEVTEEAKDDSIEIPTVEQKEGLEEENNLKSVKGFVTLLLGSAVITICVVLLGFFICNRILRQLWRRSVTMHSERGLTSEVREPVVFNTPPQPEVKTLSRNSKRWLLMPSSTENDE